MAAPKTRDRILSTSLTLFNTLGEPNVTTNHIADEMEISPGNLYYHFRNKEQIVYELFQAFEKRMDEVLVLPDERRPDMEDMWLYLHLVFETMWEYRFLYRDLVDLLSRDRRLRMRFGRILDREQQIAVAILKSLVKEGVMEAEREEIDAIAANVAIVTTFWMSYAGIRKGAAELQAEALAQGIFQVLSLVAGFLDDAERNHLRKLAMAYVR